MKKPFCFRVWLVYHIINSLMEHGGLEEYVGDDIAPLQNAYAHAHYESEKYLGLED